MHSQSSAVIAAGDADDTIAALDRYRFALLFQHGTLDVGVYAPVGRDDQNPHPKDEIYVIRAGSAVLLTEAGRQPVGPGDLAFIAADTEHRFEAISDDFSTWVLFYGPQGGEVPPDAGDTGPDPAE